MIIQIFGTHKCKDTQKAIRFFKERSIPIQFIDLKEKDISQGELNSIKRHYYIEDLIDIYSKEYERENLKYISHDIEAELLANPLLFHTPILRSDFGVTVGHRPDLWKDWAQKSK
jgi:arsenate reductase-like glutaredoxin family protein